MAAQRTQTTSTASAASTAARSAAVVADAHTVMEGAGVPVTRVLPSRDAPYRMVDPWLLLDEFKMESFGGGESFPPHPHRGFEIVTYMIQGSGHHTDSEGNSGEVRSGGLQRITAGRGIWHGEGGGSGPAGPVHGLQLWINLPRAQKQIPPGYQAVQAEQIPETTVGDARVRVLVGEGSPTQLQTPAIYLDATLPASGSGALTVPAGFQGFAYVLAGDGSFGANQLAAHERQVVVLGESDVDASFPARAGAQGVRFVLAAGRSVREVPRWNGPFVD
ncbi:MAG TPA: pirin family protein [Chloroflexota bacterium]|nr:pirin family protein [Chloroflexota bacterium]